MKSVNPATGKTIEEFAELGDAEIDARIARAAETFLAWRRTAFAERARLMARAAERLEARKEELGKHATQEMGKTLKAAVGEVEKCAWVCRYYAETAEAHLAPEEVKSSAKRSTVYYQPLGPVLAVMPWNFPFWQVFRFAAPALMAGNVGLLKHASNVPRCALDIEEIFAEAGFPPGAFQTLLIGSPKVRRVIDDPRVVAATLTGSEGAGMSVGEQAGRQIKKVVLELGGSDPFIVMPSADLEAAVKTAVAARVMNNGQSCIAAKRFIVHRAIYPEFERRYVEGMSRLKLGDPMLPDTDVGPLSTEQTRRDLERQVEASVKAGARLLLGGKAPAGPGWFYPPTVLARIPEAAPAYREEVFGPVALLFEVPGAEEAVRLANDSTFGLGASAWTRDAREVALFARELETGQVFVNAMVASDPRLPFGGVKRSGHGRELGRWGIREFTNAKTVYLAESAPLPEGG
jgi:succinate-semialdehyde dehydrogenase / glutarate-semialdehyde dehydrogenase